MHDPVMLEKVKQVADSLKRGRAGRAYGGAGDLAMRRAGWTVALHTDSVENGALRTRWMFAHSRGRWVNGAGATTVRPSSRCSRRSGVRSGGKWGGRSSLCTRSTWTSSARSSRPVTPATA